MRLLPLEAFSAVFEPLRGKRIGFVPPIGNVGDELITWATHQLFDEFQIVWRPFHPGSPGAGDVDEVVFGGGGNMGTRYRNNWALRGKILELGLPLTILPQSFTSVEDRPYTRVYVRERASLAFCDNGILAPDLALGLRRPSPKPPTRHTGIFLRRDPERLGWCRWFRRDPVKLCNSPREYLDLAAGHERIVTDRLHFAICGLLAGRETTLLPNNYHKNRSMHETWLAAAGVPVCRQCCRSPGSATRSGVIRLSSCRPRAQGAQPQVGKKGSCSRHRRKLVKYFSQVRSREDISRLPHPERQKPPIPRRPDAMLNRMTFAIAAALCLVPAVGAWADGPAYHWKTEKDSLSLLAGQQVVYTYHFAADEGYPYLHPLSLPGGPVLSALAPHDHPWHRGLWLAWKFLNGVNYWEFPSKQATAPEGKTAVVGPAAIQSNGTTATVQLRLEYSKGQVLLNEERTLIASQPAADGSYTIDWTSTFTAKGQDVVLERARRRRKPLGAATAAWGSGRRQRCGISMPAIARAAWAAPRPTASKPSGWISAASSAQRMKRQFRRAWRSSITRPTHAIPRTGTCRTRRACLTSARRCCSPSR